MKNKTISIGSKIIGPGHPPYIIAELSGNHNGDIERAFALMEAAKKAGADALKLQTYTADTITIDHDGPDFIVDLPLWKNRTLYNLYQEAHTPWEWHDALFAKGRELEISVFSSPFDFTAIDFLENLNAPAYKIASSELVDIPLIEKAASTGKPLIISTGMGSVEEIEDAVNAARETGCQELVLLHCVSAYPTPYDQMNLANLIELANKFDVITGLSDHTLGTAVAVSAVALGACLLEKHLTMSRDDGGIDSSFSIEPEELKQLVEDSRIAAVACSGPDIGPKVSEQQSLKYRRSLYVVKNMKAGDVFDTTNIRSIRPAFGLKPKHYQSILNRHATRALKRGEPLVWDMIVGGGP